LGTNRIDLELTSTAANLLQPNRHYEWVADLTQEIMDSIAGYYALGEEIWRQTNGEIDAFVHCVGTGASSRGAATVLK